MNKIQIAIIVGALMLGFIITETFIFSDKDNLSIEESPEESLIISNVFLIGLGGTTNKVAEQNGDNCADNEIIFLRTDYDDKDFLIDTCYNIDTGEMRIVKEFKKSTNQ